MFFNVLYIVCINYDDIQKQVGEGYNKTQLLMLQNY